MANEQPSRHHLTRFIPRELRALEAFMHRAWLRLIVALFAKRGAPLPDWSDRPYRVLFIRYDRLGDMVLCTGVLRAIADAHPLVSIDVLTTPANAPVLMHLPFVRDVILHERGRWRSYPGLLRRLWAGRYDAVIDGLVVRPSVNSYTTMLMLASRATWRIGCDGRPHDLVYNVPVHVHDDTGDPPEHHVEHLARLATPFGLKAHEADWRPTLRVTADERDAAGALWRRAPGDGPRIFVNLSAGHPCRRWPDERFATLLAALRLKAPGARVILAALPAERTSAERLAGSIDALAVIPTVRQILALVASSDLVISPDTAVTHIASAFERRTLALLRRREEFRVWAPYRTPGVNVFGHSELSLEGLPADSVVAALDAVLDFAASSSITVRRPRIARFA